MKQSDDERTRRGLDVLTTLGGSRGAGEGIRTFFESQGAIGGLALRYAAGEIWSREQLSRRDRSLVVISILTALGRTLELQQHVVGGLSHGLERAEIDEIMVQLSQYIGMPLALGGAGIANRAFAALDGADERKDSPAPLEYKSDEERRRDGQDVLRTLLGMPEGSDMGFAVDATLEQLGDMGRFVVDTAFGEVWARPQLSRRDRSVAVVSALAASNLTHELEIHTGAALNHGVTQTEVEELLLTVAVYGGFPRAIDGIHIAKRVFEAREASSP